MRVRLAAALLAAVVVAVGALPTLRWVLWRQELNPVLRGELLARRNGCFACHRPWGTREVPNPGSRWGSVPRFAAGNARMYAENRAEIEELIRFGAPRSWLDEDEARRRLEAQHLRMPAYGDRLEAREIRDLVAFTAAVERVDPPGSEAAAAGREAAAKHGCLACHGVEGSGGLANPGSLGGFIPGFAGGNFPDLVRDRAEFDEWVRDGTSRRLEGNPLVRFFWRRQEISMPAYGDELSAEELDRLWDWVAAIRGGG